MPPLQRSRTGQVIGLGQVLGLSDVDEVAKSSWLNLTDKLPPNFHQILEKLTIEVEIAKLKESWSHVLTNNEVFEWLKFSTLKRTKSVGNPVLYAVWIVYSKLPTQASDPSTSHLQIQTKYLSSKRFDEYNKKSIALTLIPFQVESSNTFLQLTTTKLRY